MDPRLMEAARTGDIDVLYALIHEDPYILERIDQVPFVETPFHVAAFEGHINFVIEMMNIQPSFARKLNQDGLSPIHLALKNEQTKLVLRLLETDKDLARVKGREGMTPLHLVITTGNTGLLFELLEACPECIEDVTVNGDTALHLALKSDQIEAFDLMVGWLQINSHKCPYKWETKIVNRRDNEDNTALHIAAKSNQHQALKHLLNSHLDVDIYIKDSKGLTALDIIEPEKTERKLKKYSCRKETKYSRCLKPHLNRLERRSAEFGRLKKNMSHDQLNAVLAVAVLVFTVTYQSSVSPPGGVIPPDCSSSTSNDVTNIFHSGSSSDFFQNKYDVETKIPGIVPSGCSRDFFQNKSDVEPKIPDIVHSGGSSDFFQNESDDEPMYPGSVVMDSEDYSRYWFINSFTLWYTSGLIAWLFSDADPDLFHLLILLPLILLGLSYHYSMGILSPSANWLRINVIMMLLFEVCPLVLISYPGFREVQAKRRDKAYFLKCLNRRARRQEGYMFVVLDLVAYWAARVFAILVCYLLVIFIFNQDLRSSLTALFGASTQQDPSLQNLPT